jgi:two-component sensor histidine kinase
VPRPVTTPPPTPSLAAPRLLPYLVLTVGLVASVLAGLGVDRFTRARDQERFANSVEQAHGDIQTRLQAYVAVLHAGAGLFVAQDGAVTREEFRVFSRRLDLPRLYPGIQGLGFTAVLPGVDGPEVRRQLTAMGADDVQVHPATPRPEAHAIVHLEPLDRRNAAAIGFDMYSEPTRREAMARARDSGRTAMSGKVELVQEIDAQKQAGFLIYEPIYGDASDPPATVAERRARLTGFVYSPFRADDLLRGIFGAQSAPRLHIAVYDQTVGPRNLLHKSFAGDPDVMDRNARLRTQSTLEVAGRPWTVVYYSGPAFELDSARGLGWAFFLGGLAATLVATAASFWQLRARLAVEAEINVRRAGEEQRQLLIGELNHRVKNTLATVQSIAAQAFREGKSLKDTRESFEARLLALSLTHDLLTRESWRGAELRELAEAELAPYRTEAAPHRLTLEGPEVLLTPNTALALGMALHELATNAVKYGALSRPEGQVRLSWQWRQAPQGLRLTLEWRETGGPPVEPPTRPGFGTRLITSGLRHQLQGEVELDFHPEGLRCVIDVPTADQRDPGASA